MENTTPQQEFSLNEHILSIYREKQNIKALQKSIDDIKQQIKEAEERIMLTATGEAQGGEPPTYNYDFGSDFEAEISFNKNGTLYARIEKNYVSISDLDLIDDLSPYEQLIVIGIYRAIRDINDGKRTGFPTVQNIVAWADESKMP